MDLSNRCGRRGFAIEAVEHFFKWAAKLSFDHLTDYFERLGGYPVSKTAELGDQLVGKDAVARRNDLPEFDIRGAQTLARSS